MKKRSKFLAMLLSTAVAVSSLTGISVFAADKTSGEEETRTVVNNPVPVSLLSGDRKPQIRFLGNHHSGSGNLYHKSFRM